MKGTVFGVVVVVVTMPAAMEAGWAELFSLLEDGVLVGSTLALIHELKRSYLEGSAASSIHLLVSRQTGPSHHRPHHILYRALPPFAIVGVRLWNALVRLNNGDRARGGGGSLSEFKKIDAYGRELAYMILRDSAKDLDDDEGMLRTMAFHNTRR